MTKITIKEVAKKAGVCVATVSRVINANYPVSKDVAKRVNSAIKELEFTPHAMASNIKSRKSKMVGMIASTLVNNTIMLMTKGVESALESHGYLLSISSTDNDFGKEQRLVRFFQERMVDAVIVITSAKDTKVFEPLRKRGIPVVLLTRVIHNSNMDTVTENNHEASQALTKAVLDHGHRRIMVIASPNFDVAVDRYNGFAVAMREAGVGIDPQLVLDGDFSMELARQKVLDYFRSHQAADYPSVIYSFSGLMTEGVMRALIELGLRIPDDISLVSYDSVGFSELFHPVIACVRQNSLHMGQQAGNLVLQRLNEGGQTDDNGVKIIVNSEIVMGESLRRV